MITAFLLIGFAIAAAIGLRIAFKAGQAAPEAAAKRRVKELDDKLAELHQELKQVSPLAIRVRQLNSQQRVITSLEKEITGTNTSIDALQRKVHTLQFEAARNEYTATYGRIPEQCSALLNQKLEAQTLLAELQMDLAAARAKERELADEIGELRATLKV